MNNSPRFFLLAAVIICAVNFCWAGSAFALDAPGNFDAEESTETTITWKWDAVPSADGYEIHDDSTNTAVAEAGASATSVVETGLSPNTAYVRHCHAYTLSTSSETTTISPGQYKYDRKYPINIFYNYARCQMLYLQSEINYAGAITKIRFQQTNSYSPTIHNCTIYMYETDDTELTSWQGGADGAGTQVFSGDLTTRTSPGWFEIILDSSFNYSNTKNLLISFRHQDGSWELYPNWKVSNAVYRCVEGGDDTDNPPDVSGCLLPNIQIVVEVGERTYSAPSNVAEYSTAAVTYVANTLTPTYTITGKVKTFKFDVKNLRSLGPLTLTTDTKMTFGDGPQYIANLSQDVTVEVGDKVELVFNTTKIPIDITDDSPYDIFIDFVGTSGTIAFSYQYKLPEQVFISSDLHIISAAIGTSPCIIRGSCDFFDVVIESDGKMVVEGSTVSFDSAAVSGEIIGDKLIELKGNNLIMHSGCKIKADDNGIKIIADIFTMEQGSILDATGAGYGSDSSSNPQPTGGGGSYPAKGGGYPNDSGGGGGAGYGGKGGDGENPHGDYNNPSGRGLGGKEYGSIERPTEQGSCGGGVPAATGGKGGGRIRIVAKDTLTVNGTIEANGLEGRLAPDGVFGPGGGSGGSIWITALNFKGSSGSIHADGGFGGGLHITGFQHPGGGGGGGKIHIECAKDDFGGMLSANGGLAKAPAENGSNGTIKRDPPIKDGIIVQPVENADYDLINWDVALMVQIQINNTTDETDDITALNGPQTINAQIYLKWRQTPPPSDYSDVPKQEVTIKALPQGRVTLDKTTLSDVELNGVPINIQITPSGSHSQSVNDTKIIAQILGQSAGDEDMTVVSIEMPQHIRRDNTPSNMSDRIPPRAPTNFLVKIKPDLGQTGQKVGFKILHQSAQNGEVKIFNPPYTSGTDLYFAVSDRLLDLRGTHQTEAGNPPGQYAGKLKLVAQVRDETVQESNGFSIAAILEKIEMKYLRILSGRVNPGTGEYMWGVVYNVHHVSDSGDDNDLGEVRAREKVIQISGTNFYRNRQPTPSGWFTPTADLDDRSAEGDTDSDGATLKGDIDRLGNGVAIREQYFEFKERRTGSVTPIVVKYSGFKIEKRAEKAASGKHYIRVTKSTHANNGAEAGEMGIYNGFLFSDEIKRR